MKLIFENWRQYTDGIDEKKQTQLLEKYFDEKDILTEAQELELLNEIDIPDLSTLEAVWTGLGDIISGGKDIATTALEAPGEIADAAASVESTAASVESTAASVESIVTTLGAIIAQLLGAPFWAFLGYKLLKLVFEYVLKQKALSKEEMKLKFESFAGQKEFENEVHSALIEEPGLLSKILSPIEKIRNKIKKMFSFFSKKKSSNEDAEAVMEALFENWNRHLPKSQLLTEEQISEYILNSDIEHLWENNNYEKLDEGVKNWLTQSAHLILDILGAAGDFVVPGAGAVFDLINMLWYLKRAASGEKKCWLYAAFSAISLIPYIGDLIGKGAKFSSYIKKGAAAIKALKLAIHNNQDKIDKVFNTLETSEKVPSLARDNAGAMRGAVRAFSGAQGGKIPSC